MGNRWVDTLRATGSGRYSEGRLAMRVGGLDVCLETREAGIPLTAPGCHEGFEVEAVSHDALGVAVRLGRLRSTVGWHPLFVDPPTWALWLDENGWFVFDPPRSVPPRRQVTVDPSFRRGEALLVPGDGWVPGQPVYPLIEIDMPLFANWLAASGDLIIHSAGIDDRGIGYCFVGASGAGKSTVAEELARWPGLRVLGEDQVIVRRLDGEVYIFGTPWHMDRARCLPDGVPLRKLFFLDRWAEEGVHRCGPDETAVRLLRDAFIPYYNRAGVERILGNVSWLAGKVASFRLSYRLGIDLLDRIRRA